MITDVKFKNEAERVVLIGRADITPENLTVEKYRSLVKEYPAFKEKFNVTGSDEEEVETEESENAE